MWKLMKQRKEYYKKKHYAYNYDNLDETDKFLKDTSYQSTLQEQRTAFCIYFHLFFKQKLEQGLVAGKWQSQILCSGLTES